MKLYEKNVEAMLVRACNKKGFKCPKTEMIARGFPDRMVFNTERGEIYYVEFKNKTNYKRSDLQESWGARIKFAGGKYFLLDGEEETRKFIQNYIL